MSSEKIAWAARLGLAQLVVAFLFALNLVNISIPHTGDIRPLFLLMGIYYWAVFRPTLLPPAMAFTWGLLFDLLAGLPLGLNAFLFLIVQWVVRDQRIYLMGQSFLMLWAGFSVTALVYGLLQWALFALALFTLPDWRAPLATILLSIGLFPLISLLLVFAHRFLPSEPMRGLR